MRVSETGHMRCFIFSSDTKTSIRSKAEGAYLSMKKTYAVIGKLRLSVAGKIPFVLCRNKK